MLYYYNKDGIFQKESSKSYKTEKGAVDRLRKEGEGAVFDETGKMITSIEAIQKAPEEEPGKAEPSERESKQLEEPHETEPAEEEPVKTEQPEGESKQPEEEPHETEPAEEKPGKAEQSEGESKQLEEEPHETEPAEGEPVETEQPEGESKQPEEEPFEVQTTCDSLRIRAGAGRLYRVTGCITEKAENKTNHLIVEEKNGWGRLQDGTGWIALAFTKRVS